MSSVKPKTKSHNYVCKDDVSRVPIRVKALYIPGSFLYSIRYSCLRRVWDVTLTTYILHVLPFLGIVYFDVMKENIYLEVCSKRWFDFEFILYHRSHVFFECMYTSVYMSFDQVKPFQLFYSVSLYSVILHLFQIRMRVGTF